MALRRTKGLLATEERAKAELAFVEEELASLRRTLLVTTGKRRKEVIEDQIEDAECYRLELASHLGLAPLEGVRPGRNQARLADRNRATRTFKAEVSASGRLLACEVCGWRPPAGIPEGAVNAHHIIPVVRGGSDDQGNLILLCPNCHLVADRAWRRYRGGWHGPTNRDELLVILNGAK